MDLVLKGLEGLENWANKKTKEHEKALQNALSVTMFDAHDQLKKDLKEGNLNLDKLSILKKSNVNVTRPPLAKLESGITYWINKNTLKMKIGFGAKPGTGKWQTAIAKRSAKPEGSKWKYTENQLKKLHKRGIHITKQIQKKGAQVPYRSIVKIFTEKYETKIFQTIKEYYLRKLKGEFIENKGGL